MGLRGPKDSTLADMPYFATTVVDGDGITTDWEFNFYGVTPGNSSGTKPYLFEADVKVVEQYEDVNGDTVTVERARTFLAANRIRVTGDPVIVGHRIKIFRNTELRYPLVDYRDQQTVSELDLDLANRQAIYVAQETLDRQPWVSIGEDGSGHYTARNRRLVDLANGILPGDAVNLGQLTAVTTDFNDRALRVPSSEAPILSLPAAVSRANKFLGFDATGAHTLYPVVGSAVDLMTQLAAETGSNMIGYRPDPAARPLTVQQKLSQTRHIDDFPPLPAETLLTRAALGTPLGWTLQLGYGPYLGDHVITRDDLYIRGLGVPVANASRSKLVGGTIIKGKFHFRGNNIGASGFGADRGLEVCNTYFGGVADDAFVIAPTQPAIIQNVHLENVAGLCKDSASLVHPMLLQGLDKATIKNVTGYLGFTGPVFKITNSTVDGASGYGNSQSGIQIKSDSYAPCNRSTFTNLIVDAEGKDLANSAGVFLYAATSQLQFITLGTTTVRGHRAGCALNGISATINDIHLGTMLFETPTDIGLSSDGANLALSFDHIKVTKPASGRSIRLDPATLGFTGGTIEAHSAAGLTLADSLALGGCFSIDNVVTSTAYAQGLTAGITGISVTQHAGFPRAWRIGTYLANLNVNTASSGLANGWTNVGAETPHCRYRNGRAFLSLQLGFPGTPWTSKEICYNVHPYLAPPITRTFYGTAQGPTGLPVQVEVTVTAAGAVTVIALNTPALVAATLTRLNINVSWDIQSAS